MTKSPQLSDALEPKGIEALTITEDLSLMHALRDRAKRGDPKGIELLAITLGRRIHRVIGETVFGFRVPAGQ